MAVVYALPPLENCNALVSTSLTDSNRSSTVFKQMSNDGHQQHTDNVETQLAPPTPTVGPATTSPRSSPTHTNPPSGNTLAALADQLAAIASALAAQHAPVVTPIPTQDLPDAPTGSAGEAETSVASEPPSIGDDEEDGYLWVGASANPHWSAELRASERSQRPRQYSLYGCEPYDILCRTAKGASGQLGVSLSFAEPAALYGFTLKEAAAGIATTAAELHGDTRLTRDLASLANSAAAHYELLNTFRTLVEARARAQRPGVPATELAELAWVESSLREEVLPAPAQHARVAELRASFQRSAQTATLRAAVAPLKVAPPAGSARARPAPQKQPASGLAASSAAEKRPPRGGLPLPRARGGAGSKGPLGQGPDLGAH